MSAGPPVSLRTIAREWGRIGITGFGGPPAHIALLRRLCVDRRGWLGAEEFEDGIAATGLLPGPASTQLAIYCAWRLRRGLGALVGGLCFIVPGLICILALTAAFLARHPPRAIEGAALGAGAAVPVVAVDAALGLLPASWRRAGQGNGRRRWGVYLGAGAAAAALLGPALVVVLALCGVAEVLARRQMRLAPLAVALPAAQLAPATAGVASLVWEAFKVGALSYGGGFVIVPLMQHDAVTTYHWLTASQFLGVVALGQITPGPVVLTVAAVGYGAAGLGGGVLAATVAFAPSFAFVLAGGPHLQRLRRSAATQAFLSGAGPAAVGAIAGSALPLGLALGHAWQAAVLVLAVWWLLGLRRGVVQALGAAAGIGAVVALVSPALVR